LAILYKVFGKLLKTQNDPMGLYIRDGRGVRFLRVWSLIMGEIPMALENRIDSLKSRHGELEMALDTETARPFPDEVEIHTLKKEKLRIKDELESLTHH